MKKQQVETWVSICRQFEVETNGFSIPLQNLSAQELLDMKQVSEPFLGFAPFMFKITAPKSHTKLRTAIAYLSALQGFQALASEELSKKSDNGGNG